MRPDCSGAPGLAPVKLAVFLPVAEVSPSSGPLDAGGAEVLGEFRNGGGELPAPPAPEDVRSDVCHVGCRYLAVEHERQGLANAEARPADPGQLVRVRAGVCGVAPSLRRMRLSHDRRVWALSVFCFVERASRASSKCIAAWESFTRSWCRRRAMSWLVNG
jgi:hypothetical protein